MNYNKIDFIICTNNKIEFEECCLYIRSLYVPEGYEVNVLEVLNAESIFKGYNEGMNMSDARIKIYMHQDVRIIRKDFLMMLVEKFEDDSIGMIGVVGSTNIISVPWRWNAGRIIETRICNTKEDKFGDYCKDTFVKQIDGLIMATSYDIRWREDIFDGWDNYDSSQCCEFIRAGKSILVPAQDSAYCLHDCGNPNLEKYIESRMVFINEYDNMLED